MIAAWMFYCSVCALGLTAAGVLAERLLLVGRAPVRFVWVATLVLSVAIPAIVFRFSSSPVLGSVQSPAATMAPAAALSDLPAPDALPAATPSTPSVDTGWRSLLPRLDAPLIVAWIAVSGMLTVSLVGGFVALVWMRRRWERREVQDTTVYVSQRTGPAVVGALSPAIVVPEWALALEPHQLALMLRHEREHLRARDGQLLIAAQIALIAMPWNVALWWQVLSLRVAVEMDCDARVLHHADARSYGELLLEVARPHRAFNLAGMIAFAERATQLERRIRVLERHRVATSPRKLVAAGAVALLALTAAWVAPHPAAPVHVAAAQPSTHAPLTDLATIAAHDSTPAPILDAPAPRTIARSPIIQPARISARRSRSIDCANDTTIVGATYRFIYDGITLSRDNESKACELLTRLADEQLAEDAVWQATVLAARNQRQAIESQRDAGLIALLQTDADRATFAANNQRRVLVGGFGGARAGGGGGRAGVVRAGGFGGAGARGGGAGVVYIGDTIAVAGRGRSGNADTQELRRRADSLATLVRAREMGVRAVAVGSAVRLRVDTLDPAAREEIRKVAERVASAVAGRSVDADYERLFTGITMTPDAEAEARRILARSFDELRTVPEPIYPGTRLRVIHERGIVRIVSGADATLIELASSDADRATVRSRLVAVPR
jgi:beta-lactamase regulating signal transducer with metallopeptidase domain